MNENCKKYAKAYFKVPNLLKKKQKLVLKTGTSKCTVRLSDCQIPAELEEEAKLSNDQGGQLLELIEFNVIYRLTVWPD